MLSMVSTVLLSCGWQLRGHDGLNPLASNKLATFAELKVVSENRNNAFFRSFQNVLLSNSIKLDANAVLRLDLSGEDLRRQPLTYSRSGVPAQYQLTLSVVYFASRAGEILVEEREITSRRNYDFDPNLIIAKDREEQELLDEMRQELSQRIINSIQQKL